MRLVKWEDLPPQLQTEEVRPYYDALKKKKFSLFIKRVFDIVVSLLMLIILSPLFLILAIAIKIDSKGPVFYRQERVTQYGKKFRIFKFRSMVTDADKKGSQVTVNNDSRVTKVGKFIRKCRLDEISQLIDVLRGTLTFVGTRPEVPRYVNRYTPEMMATLLLPAGVTSEASIRFKDEAKMLENVENADDVYVNEVLPLKMKYNLDSIKKFGFWRDIKLMFMTVFAVLGKDYSDKPQKEKRIIAVDLGASSGRVMAGGLINDTIEYEEIHRFPNGGRMVDGLLCWDFAFLMDNIKQGIKMAGEKYEITSIGIDTWGVDFGLIDKKGKLLRDPVHYRDESTLSVPEQVFKIVPQAEIYERTGIQFINFNTLYQLYRLAHEESKLYEKTQTVLLIPDLIAYMLTGKKRTERTIASTTNVLSAHTGKIDSELLKKLGIKNKFAPIIESGESYGKLTKAVAKELGINRVKVIAVCTHDTASAVVSMPAKTTNPAYISSGTWSLLGAELQNTLTTTLASDNNFTNEIGYNKTVRFLKNIMGLWILQNVKKTYEENGVSVSFGALMQRAENAGKVDAYIDVDDQIFSPYGDMLARVDEYLAKTNQPALKTDDEKIRCIYQSLAFKYRQRLENLGEITGKNADVLHVFGGGCQASLLNTLTANACNINLVCGPVEATAIGNIAVQLVANGTLSSIEQAREKIANRSDITTLSPSENTDSDYQKFLEVTSKIN